jgi:ComF family protein
MPLRLDCIRGVVLFEGVVRKAIHELKYRGRTELAMPLAELMVPAWGSGLFPVECLIPVPLHPRRLRERGYNQAALIAEGLAKRIRLPVSLGALARSRMTEPQTQLRAAQRQTNVAGAFTATSPTVAGRSVMLVDDVCTTGATLQACADALRSAGVERVFAMTLARSTWDYRTGVAGDAVAQ